MVGNGGRREVEDEVEEGGVHLAAGWGLHRPHLSQYWAKVWASSG